MKKRILTLVMMCMTLLMLTAGVQAAGSGAETVHAATSEALMAALTDGVSNRIITLDAKDYEIYNTATNTVTGEVYQTGFSVKNLNNVTIRGQVNTRILTPYDCGGYPVITFTDCVNVTLDTLSVGHKESWCGAPVLILKKSTGVEILNCDLWGCGFYGIGTESSRSSFHAENTTIRDCSSFIMDFRGSATFDNCKFLRNGEDSKFTSRKTAALQGSPDSVVFNSCEFTENDCSFKIESGEEDRYQFNNCTETDNTWQLDPSITVVKLTDTAKLTVNKNTGKAVISGTGAVGELPYPAASYITSVEIESGITDIGSMFQYKTKIKKIVLPDTLEEIGTGAFSSSSGLESVTIPEGVTSIGKKAFNGCSSLTSIVIPESVKTIGSKAFALCSNLCSVTIPVSTSLESDAADTFGGSNMKHIKMTGTGPIPDATEGTCNRMPWAMYITASISVELERGITDIGDYAFYKAPVYHVAIPDTVKRIGAHAFEQAALSRIEIPSSVTSIGTDAFNACTKLTDIYYNGTEDEWKMMVGGTDIGLDAAKTTIHYRTTESDYIDAAINEALKNNDLADIQTGLSKINTDGLSEAMLDSAVSERIAAKEGNTPVLVDSSGGAPDLSETDVSIVGAKVNFPTIEDLALRAGAPSKTPWSGSKLSFSAKLVSGETEQSAESLPVPVAITVKLPDKYIKPETIRVWHIKNSSTQQVPLMSLGEDGRTLTFILTSIDASNDFMIMYDTFSPFSVSLTGLNTVRVVDEWNTLADCKSIYAASYDADGNITDLLSGVLSGNVITFTNTITTEYFLFFLDGNYVPLQPKTALAS